MSTITLPTQPPLHLSVDSPLSFTVVSLLPPTLPLHTYHSQTQLVTLLPCPSRPDVPLLSLLSPHSFLATSSEPSSEPSSSAKRKHHILTLVTATTFLLRTSSLPLPPPPSHPPLSSLLRPLAPSTSPVPLLPVPPLASLKFDEGQLRELREQIEERIERFLAAGRHPEEPPAAVEPVGAEAAGAEKGGKKRKKKKKKDKDKDKPPLPPLFQLISLCLILLSAPSPSFPSPSSFLSSLFSTDYAERSRRCKQWKVRSS